jgi:hypothetical protein
MMKAMSYRPKEIVKRTLEKRTKNTRVCIKVKGKKRSNSIKFKQNVNKKVTFGIEDKSTSESIGQIKEKAERVSECAMVHAVHIGLHDYLNYEVVDDYSTYFIKNEIKVKPQNLKSNPE